MIEDAERDGKISRGSNRRADVGKRRLGLALCAAKGYKLILTMPENVTGAAALLQGMAPS